VYSTQKFPPHLKCSTTLPSEIWMLKIVTKLALIIHKLTGAFNLWAKFKFNLNLNFLSGTQCCSLVLLL